MLEFKSRIFYFYLYLNKFISKGLHVFPLDKLI